MTNYRTVTVQLFKESGKYYTSESWRIPRRIRTDHTGEEIELTLIEDVKDSPDFRRIGNGAVLVPSEPEFDGDENFGFPVLFTYGYKENNGR